MIKPLWGIAAVAFLGTTGVVGAVLVTSSGGTEEAVQVQDSPNRNSTELPSLTPSPRSSPPPSPSGAASPSATPSTPLPAVTAAPGGQAPGGCVNRELIYQDPTGRFAFCYPSDVRLITIEDNFDPSSLGTSVEYPFENGDGLVASISWTKDSSTAMGDPCNDADFVVSHRVEKLSISRKMVDACFQDGTVPNQPDIERKGIRFEVAATEGGYVAVYVVYGRPTVERGGATLESVAMRLINSLAVN